MEQPPLKPLRRRGLDLGDDSDGLAIPHHPHAHFRTCAHQANGVFQIRDILNRALIDGNHHITHLQPSLRRRRLWLDTGYQHPVVPIHAKGLGHFRRQGLPRDTKAATADLAIFHQLRHQLADHIGGNSEADADIATGRGQNSGIDPNQLTTQVDQRAAGIAGVDGGVGLDEIFIPLNTEATAPQGADDARGNGLPQAKGVANRHHKITYPQLVGVGDRERRQLLRRNLDQRHIGLRISPHHRGVENATITQRHLDLLCLVDHVIVGQNITTLSINNHPRAQALGLTTLGLLLLRHAKKTPEKGIVQ